MAGVFSVEMSAPAAVPPPIATAVDEPNGTRVYVVCSKFTDVASLRSLFEAIGDVTEVRVVKC